MAKPYYRSKYMPTDEDAEKIYPIVGCLLGGCLQYIVGLFVLMAIIGFIAESCGWLA